MLGALIGPDDAVEIIDLPATALQELRAEAFTKGEDVGEGSPGVLARPSQEHLDAAAKFQLSLRRQRSGQLPTTSGPAPVAAPPSHPFLSRHSPTVKTEVRSSLHTTSLPHPQFRFV